MNAEQHEASCKLLMAEHDLKHAQNNANAFAFRKQIATTPDAQQDAAGSECYWRHQIIMKTATVNELKSIINRHF
jgi:hypothetical protein